MNLRLLKSTGLVSFMTLISRILGFVRDMVTAYFFGPGMGLDAFVVASKIPNFMRRLFAEGAFSQAFVPLLSQYQKTGDIQATRAFINGVFGALSLVLFAITALGIVLAPLWIAGFAPGFVDEPDKYALSVAMLRITFPYLLFIALTAMAGGILNTHGQFAVPAFTPVFLNLSLIASAIFLSPYCKEPVMALAIGTFLGGVIQLLFQWPFLSRLGLLPRFTWGFSHPGVKRLLKLMLPALLGVSVNQLNLLLSTLFASFLPTGSLSWLYYAERLMEFPTGGFGVALATVVLPHLARCKAKQDDQAFSRTLDFGLRWVLLLAVPSSVGLLVLSGPLVITLFTHHQGNFGLADAYMTQSALMAYAPSVLGFMLAKVLASGFYANQDIKTPVKIAMATVLVNLLGNTVFMPYLGHTGLALATSLSALFNAGALAWVLYRRRLWVFESAWPVYLLRLCVSSGIMVGILYLANLRVSTWFELSLQTRVVQLLGWITLASLCYVAALLLTGLRKRDLLHPTDAGAL